MGRKGMLLGVERGRLVRGGGYRGEIIVTRLYIALFTLGGRLKEHFQHYYPWSLGLNSFLKQSQLPEEYTGKKREWLGVVRGFMKGVVVKVEEGVVGVEGSG